MQKLLEKYWAGESSLEEEAILRKAVNDPEASEELVALRNLFVGSIEKTILPISAAQKFDAVFQNIQAEEILKKYWAGESSLEEETILRKAVHDPAASKELKKYAAMFEAPKEEVKLSGAAEEKMEAFFAKIQKEEKPQAKIRTLAIRKWMQIAAIGLLLVSMGWWWSQRVYQMQEKERIVALETYEQTKQALAMMGLHFKTGEEKTLNSIIDASEKLDILN